MTLVLGCLLVGLGLFRIGRSGPWEEAATRLIAYLGSSAGSLWALVYTFGLLFALAVLIAVLAGGRKRRHAARDVVFAALLSVLLSTLLSLVANRAWPYVLPELGLEDPTPRFPVLRVAIVAAVLVASGPHLTRPMRRLGWVTVFLTAFASVGLRYGDPSDAIGAFGIGLVAAGGILLAYGSPRGYPSLASVEESLRRMGLPLDSLDIDPEQSWGVRRFVGWNGDVEIAVKVLGRDASDSQLMAKVWRSLIYREQGATLTHSRLQGVEHEALVTLLAGRAGVSVPHVLAVGQASPEIALLAVERNGNPLSTLDDEEITDELLSDVWREVGLLRAASIAHGALTTDAITVADRRPVIGEFALGWLSAQGPHQSRDLVELLFSLSLLVGVDRAVATAVEALGREAVVSAFPYLQLAAISGQARGRADSPKHTMKALQAAAVSATGTELPEPIELLRVSRRHLINVALLLLAAYALVPLLADIDYASTWEVLAEGNWALLVGALMMGQSYFIPQAMATGFAVGEPLPFWPLVSLQIAARYIGLAVPSAAGRVAMNAAFLNKFGVPITLAVTQGAIDTFSAFLVQVVILVIGFVSSDLDFEIRKLDLPWEIILIVVLVLVVAFVLVVLRVQQIRNRVLPVLVEARVALSGILRQPSRALGLLGSNLLYWLTLGTTLWLVLIGVGVDIGFGSALVVVLAADLLAGFVPVPGGVGVAEAVMTGFLVALGVDEPAALAATVAYRFITFYLPVIEGFFALKWLERNEYL